MSEAAGGPLFRQNLGTDEGPRVQVLLSNLLMATRASATAAATCPSQPYLPLIFSDLLSQRRDRISLAMAALRSSSWPCARAVSSSSSVL